MNWLNKQAFTYRQAVDNWRKPASGRLLVPAFFLLLFVVGVVILPDYGIGWDEDGQHEKGRIAYDYVHTYFGWEHTPLEPEKPFARYDQSFYNVLFPLTAVTLTQMVEGMGFELSDRAIVLIFHYLLFSICFIGFIAFYKTLKARLGDWRWALLGLCLLLLSPRVSFHTFFNVKDSVLQAGVTIAAATFLYFIRRLNFKRGLLHGLSCGLAIAIRPVALILLPLTIGFILVELLNRPLIKREQLVGTLAFLAAVPFVVVLGWPYLWEDPFWNFLTAWEKFSSFPWTGSLILFNEKLDAANLPWYYLPGWIVATIPILVIFAFIGGISNLLYRWVGSLTQLKVYDSDELRMDLFQAALLVGAISAIIYFGSVLYDAWRHVYFVYPALVYLATVGLYHWWKFAGKRKWTVTLRISRGIVVTSLAILLAWCVWLHPYQYNYFNLLAGNNLELRYEVDYWGVGFQPTIRKLLEVDDRPKIRLTFSNYPGMANARILPPDLAERVEMAYDTSGGYHYFIANFRWQEERKKYRDGTAPYVNPLFSVDYLFGRGKMYEVYVGPGIK